MATTTAYEVATAVKNWIDVEYGSTPGFFDRMHGMILTHDEAERLHCDLYTVGDNLVFSIVIEGIYEWPMKAWQYLNARFPEWQFESLTGYALGIYPA